MRLVLSRARHQTIKRLTWYLFNTLCTGASPGRAAPAKKAGPAMIQQQRAAYPRNWPRLSRQCKMLAGWRCQQCGIAHGEQYVARSGRQVVCYLHAAHLDHDKSNPHPRLKALCPTCHGLLDHEHRERATCTKLERMKHQHLLKQQGYLVRDML